MTAARFRQQWARVAMLFCCWMLSATSATAAVPDAIQAQLQRGINLSFWFTYRGDPTIDPLRFRPDDADLRQLRAIGFRHARIAFDHAWLVDPADPRRVHPQRVAELGDALAKVASVGLLPVLTMNADSAFLQRLLAQAAVRDSTAAFWWSLSRALASRLPADKLVFEVLNEPANDDAAASLKVMQTLAGAVRDAAPRHTIVVAGHRYSSVDELLALVPFQDDNLVYTFHFYEPFNFTHQGATWGWPMWTRFHDFPYPSSPAAVAPLLPQLDDEARSHASWYGQQSWNRDKLAVMLDQVAAWRDRHRVVVWCSEFGVLKTHAPVASRQAWLRDTRELLEARKIGWAHFDFSQHMGLVDGVQGARQWDRGAVQALGLPPPR